MSRRSTPSYFWNSFASFQLKTMARLGMFTPTANVSVVQSTRIKPSYRAMLPIFQAFKSFKPSGS